MTEDHTDRFGVGGVVMLIVLLVAAVICEEFSVPFLNAVFYSFSGLTGLTGLSYVLGWLIFRVEERVNKWGDG